MSIASAIFDNKIQNFEQAFNVKDITSQAMKDAIKDWHNLYYATDTPDTEDPCQRLPATIVNKLTRAAFSEYEATATKEFAKKILEALNRRNKQALQQALIGGECFLKPLFVSGRIEFSVIPRRNYLALGRNETDAITDIGTQECTEEGQYYYTLLERRTIDEAGHLTIQSRLYRSDTKGVIGTRMPLNTLLKYKALEDSYTFTEPLWSTGLIPVKNLSENCVDGSEDGVSIYAAASGLIHLINVNEKQISGEFERGESRIIVSQDMMKKDATTGKRKFTDHIFTGLDDDPETVGVTIFSPEFREQSFLARKNEYLRNIESIIGLERGILSDVEAVQKTATEVTTSKGGYAITITDLQEMWTNAVKEALRVCSILGKLYKVEGTEQLDPEKDAVLDYGDGVLYDRDKVWQEYQSMVASGMLDPTIAIAWYYDLPFPETDAEKEEIRKKYLPQMEELIKETGDEE